MTSCQNVGPHPVVLMMDLYSSLSQRKTYRTVLVVGDGAGGGNHMCVYVCVRERDRMRVIVFSLRPSIALALFV